MTNPVFIGFGVFLMAWGLYPCMHESDLDRLVGSCKNFCGLSNPTSAQNGDL